MINKEQTYIWKTWSFVVDGSSMIFYFQIHWYWSSKHLCLVFNMSVLSNSAAGRLEKIYRQKKKDLDQITWNGVNQKPRESVALLPLDFLVEKDRRFLVRDHLRQVIPWTFKHRNGFQRTHSISTQSLPQPHSFHHPNCNPVHLITLKLNPRTTFRFTKIWLY